MEFFFITTNFYYKIETNKTHFIKLNYVLHIWAKLIQNIYHTITKTFIDRSSDTQPYKHEINKFIFQ